MLLNRCSPSDITLHCLVTGLTNSMACIISPNYSSTVKMYDKHALLDSTNICSFFGQLTSFAHTITRMVLN
jgi:hypothetical protein